MEVRPATGADALAIATIHVRSWQVAYRGLLPQSYLDGLDPLESRDRWDGILATTHWPSTGTLVLVDTDADADVAESEGEGEVVMGFANFGATRDEDDDQLTVGELRTLYLDPDRWRRGGGSVLLLAAQDHLGRAGFTVASAWVLETNARARTFYEHHHWRFDGTSKPHDWGTFTVTDVRYRVSLA